MAVLCVIFTDISCDLHEFRPHQIGETKHFLFNVIPYGKHAAVATIAYHFNNIVPEL